MSLSALVSAVVIPAVAVTVAVAATLRARDLLPGGRRDRQGLALALAGLAVGTTALVSPVYDALGRLTGLANVGEPLARTALMACAVGVLTMISQLAGANAEAPAEEGRHWLRRRRTWLALAVAVLWTCFAVGPHAGPVNSYIVTYAGDPAVMAYLLVFLSFVGAAFADLLRLGLRMRATLVGPLLTSGWLITAGAAAGCCFVLVRLLGLAAVGAGRSEVPTVLAWPGALLAAAASVLLVTGTLWPAARSRARALSADLSAHATSVQLYPMWSDLVRLRPAVAMEPDPGPVRAALSPRNGRWRLYRRVIELRDAVRMLRGRAVHMRESATPREVDRAADRTATALAEAVAADEAGAAVSPLMVPVVPAAASVEQEVAWWSRVARWYRLRRRQQQQQSEETEA
ncbi:MAB_1171c family putative transporter [Quadrisphaera sp. KR29]|uniref:MAB_1171c family putative transporter n=1 Tax=Quadrisphaera sp. KR29 TaxID=3461391 RepID=UPI004043DFC1